jgi:hypothetical protein
LELKAREELARARTAVTPEAEVIGVLVQDTPPRPGGEFQEGPSVALAITYAALAAEFGLGTADAVCLHWVCS